MKEEGGDTPAVRDGGGRGSYGDTGGGRGKDQKTGKTNQAEGSLEEEDGGEEIVEHVENAGKNVDQGDEHEDR